MKGRRRRRVPDDEEGESLDDLLKSVEKKVEPEEQTNNDTEAQEAEEKEPRSRRESATKLPTGKQVRKQEVRQISSLFVRHPVSRQEIKLREIIKDGK